MRALMTIGFVAVAWLGVTGPAQAGIQPASCPGAVDGRTFPSAGQLRKLVTKQMSFGQRNLASASHERMLHWVEREVRRIGFKVREEPFRVWSWLPRTRAKGQPGLDIGRAGGLSAGRAGGRLRSLPNAGAVHWSKPGARKGRLVHLGPDEEITAANSAGRVVVRDFPIGTLPYGAFGLVDLYITPDLATETGDYTRPFINELHQELLAAGRAGAAAVIFTFDVPGEQVRGYYDPHQGTLYRVPAVFVGDAEGARLRALAERGGSARVVVRAKVDRKPTRNLIATLRGQSRERIVLSSNTDGNSWVQENGVSGILALARYYADLPLRCRPRTLELAFGSAHDSLVAEGTDRYAATLKPEQVAFAFAIEHLGTREILPAPDPDGSGQRLRFTGKGETFLFAAGDSAALRQTAIAATQSRKLDRTAVLQGLGVPDAARVPPVCSMGGLGIAFHKRLIPTLAMISGPWSLYDPVFGRRALDFKRMRAQLLAAGDSVLALDGLSSAQIAGDYLEMRERRAQGAPTCPPERYPQFAPGP
jgi:hypothetical protein